MQSAECRPGADCAFPADPGRATAARAEAACVLGNVLASLTAVPGPARRGRPHTKRSPRDASWVDLCHELQVAPISGKEPKRATALGREAGPGGGLPHAAETAAAAQPDHGLGVGPQRVLVKIAASQERRSGLAESRTARERDDGRPSVWILFTPTGREHGARRRVPDASRGARTARCCRTCRGSWSQDVAVHARADRNSGQRPPSRAARSSARSRGPRSSAAT